MKNKKKIKELEAEIERLKEIINQSEVASYIISLSPAYQPLNNKLVDFDLDNIDLEPPVIEIDGKLYWRKTGERKRMLDISGQAFID